MGVKEEEVVERVWEGKGKGKGEGKRNELR